MTYTIEQIIEALEALNATNTTESYVSNLANKASEYASGFAKNAAASLPSAIALICVVAIVIYFCVSNNAQNERTRKILERKQTGFFRPKRSGSQAGREATRKLTQVECFKIMEVLANATDEATPADEVTTADEASEDQADDEELPIEVAEVILEDHFGCDEDDDSTSSRSGELGDDEAAGSVKADEEDGDNDSTPTASGTSNRSGISKTAETERPKKPEILYTAGGEEEQAEEFDEERLEYLNEYIGQDQDNMDESIMSDDEGYTRRAGSGIGSGYGESPAHATADAPGNRSTARRSSWHGEDNSAKRSQPMDGPRLQEDLKAKRKPTLDFPEEEKRQAEAIQSPLTRRTTDKKADRPPMKTKNSRVPTFGAEGIVPPRRTNTKESEVSATAADPETSKAVGFTHGMMQAMAHYAAQNEEGQTDSEVRYRRPQRAFRAYRSGNRRRL